MSGLTFGVKLIKNIGVLVLFCATYICDGAERVNFLMFVLLRDEKIRHKTS